MQASEAVSSTSMRYLSENIQFSIMNSIFPQSSSQLYGFGFSEAVSDHAHLQMESKLNAYDSSFYMDTEPHIQNGHIDGLYSQSPFVNYQSEPSSIMTTKRLDCPYFGFSHFTTQAATPAYDSNQQQQQPFHVERVPAQPNILGTIRSTRKRPIENADTATKRSPEIAAGNRACQSDQWTTKKKTAMSLQAKTQMLDHQVQKEGKDVQRDRVPPRRSQKLADKITALQKLVSPYGKTDTASVLHEASIFIKVFQDQIESSFHAITSTSMEDEYPQSKIMGDRQFGLRAKGFCLVPVSLTKDLIKEKEEEHVECVNGHPKEKDVNGRMAKSTSKNEVSNLQKLSDAECSQND